jgi:hypothetical protein
VADVKKGTRIAVKILWAKETTPPPDDSARQNEESLGTDDFVILLRDPVNYSFQRKDKLCPDLNDLKAAASHSDPDGIDLLLPDFDYAYSEYAVEIDAGQHVLNKRNLLPPECIYLFNVIVALEWRPDIGYLAQLRRAFQSASDFLYDVTDGQMLFGRVVVGGPSLMPCADIQIFASNRLHPRAWIFGLQEEGNKHRPVRLGRGLWNPRYRVAIDWDEPEGYRTLVHEWAHYALGLHDEYLEEGQHLVLPAHDPSSYSMMAAPALFSEIDLEKRKRLFGELRLLAHFPKFKDRRLELGQEIGGPHRFPAPLPRWHERFIDAPLSDLQLVPLPEEWSHPPQHSWVYVLRGNQGGGRYEKLISYGSADLRSTLAHVPLDRHAHHLDQSEKDKLYLPGVQDEDMVVIATVVKDNDVKVFHYEVSSRMQQPFWKASEPYRNLPSFVLRPEVTAQSSTKQLKTEDLQANLTLWLHPLTQEDGNIKGDAKKLETNPETIDTFDGHILMQWQENNNDHLLIVPFSQGGVGPSHGGVHSPPDTAGASDGSVIVFFKQPQAARGEAGTHDTPPAGPGSPHPPAHKDYSHVRIVTTRLYAPQKPLDKDEASMGPYVYALAATHSLKDVAEYKPTLVLYYDRPAEGAGATFGYKPILCHMKHSKFLQLISRLLARVAPGYLARLTKNMGVGWRELKTESHAPVDRGLVAIPLNGKTAPGLFNDPLEPEYYRLKWVPA